MLAIKKNTMIVASMVVLLVLAGVLNFYLTRTDQDQVAVDGGVLTTATLKPASTESVTTSTDTSVDSITTFQQARTASREEQIKYLDSIIDSDKTDAETLKAAQEEKLDLVGNMEHETTIEGLLAAKGFTSAVVTCSDTTVNVVVACESLTDTQVAQILDIVRSETDVNINGIKIIPVRS